MPTIVYKKKSWRAEMLNKYDPVVETDDPEITLRIPTQILKDLVLRSEENGSSVEYELAKRMARSLEHDLKMIEEDNDEAVKALRRIQSDPLFASKIFSK